MISHLVSSKWIYCRIGVVRFVRNVQNVVERQYVSIKINQLRENDDGSLLHGNVQNVIMYILLLLILLFIQLVGINIMNLFNINVQNVIND